MSQELRTGTGQTREAEVERRDTGLRILLTVLFVVIAAVIESVLGLIVVFELLFTLVTRRPPSSRVRDLANRIVSYYYRIGRFLTYNESRIPFPFADFPPAVEGDAWSPGERESDALGLATEPEEGSGPR